MSLSRRTLFAGASALGVAALVGCSSTPSGAGAPATVDPNQVKGNLSLAMWNADQQPTMRKILDAFTAKYPEATVEIQITPSNQYWTKLQTQASGKQLPDVFFMNGPNFQLYASENQLMNLSGLFGGSGLDKADYPESLVKIYDYEGDMYAVPRDFDTVGLWYNRRMFDKAGEQYPGDNLTWDEFHQLAKRLSEKLGNGIYGAAIPFSGNQESWYNAIAQAGGYVIDPTGTKSGYGDPAAIKAIEYFKSMIDDGSVPNVQHNTDTPADALFASGKAAMAWGGSWKAKNLSLSDEAKNVAITNLPTDEKQACIIHGLGYAVSANTKFPDAARALAAFLGSKEAADLLGSEGVVMPAFAGTAQQWVDANPTMDLGKALAAATTYAVPYPVSKRTAAWQALEAEHINAALTGEQPVEVAMKALASAMDEKLAAES